MDLHLSISVIFCDSVFDLVICLYSDGDIPRSTSYDVFISLRSRFARAHDYNVRDKVLILKLVKHDSIYHKLRKAF